MCRGLESWAQRDQGVKGHGGGPAAKDIPAPLLQTPLLPITRERENTLTHPKGATGGRGPPQLLPVETNLRNLIYLFAYL